MTVPVLICPVLNRVDLLEEMLNSIDETVGLVYIIDNGNCVPDDIKCAWAQKIHVVHPNFNLGVGRSWNFGIEANVKSPWWLIVNNDVTLNTGALSRTVNYMNDSQGTSRIVCIRAFGAFAINDTAVNAVGWFDENYAPIYYEDTDWGVRASHLGVERIDIPDGAEHYGGGGENSWRNNPSLSMQNSETIYLNRAYFDAKWGTNREFTHPFGDETLQQSFWVPPSLSELRIKRWELDKHDIIGT